MERNPHNGRVTQPINAQDRMVERIVTAVEKKLGGGINQHVQSLFDAHVFPEINKLIDAVNELEAKVADLELR